MTINITVYDALHQFIGVIPERIDPSFQEMLNDPGTGSFRVHPYALSITDNPRLLDYGNIVKMEINGFVFAWSIESVKHVEVGSGEESSLLYEVSGSGVLNLLREMIVYPEYGLPSLKTEPISAGTVAPPPPSPPPEEPPPPPPPPPPDPEDAEMPPDTGPFEGGEVGPGGMHSGSGYGFAHNFTVTEEVVATHIGLFVQDARPAAPKRVVLWAANLRTIVGESETFTGPLMNGDQPIPIKLNPARTLTAGNEYFVSLVSLAAFDDFDGEWPFKAFAVGEITGVVGPAAEPLSLALFGSFDNFKKSVIPEFQDSFNRSASTTVGNGWTEIGGWSIKAGISGDNYAHSTDGVSCIIRNYGAYDTTSIQGRVGSLYGGSPSMVLHTTQAQGLSGGYRCYIDLDATGTAHNVFIRRNNQPVWSGYSSVVATLDKSQIFHMRFKHFHGIFDVFVNYRRVGRWKEPDAILKGTWSGAGAGAAKWIGWLALELSCDSTHTFLQPGPAAFELYIEKVTTEPPPPPEEPPPPPEEPPPPPEEPPPPPEDDEDDPKKKVEAIRERGVEIDRPFSFVSIRGIAGWYKDEMWAAPEAREYANVTEGNPRRAIEVTAQGGFTPLPDKFHDKSAKWIWDTDPNSNTTTPAVYFRKEFDVDKRMIVSIWAAADNAYELYLDGSMILTHDNWQQPKQVSYLLEKGHHIFAAYVVNAPMLDPNASNPAGFLMSCFERNAEGTEQSNPPVNIIVHSDETWVCRSAAKRPLPTWHAGHIMMQLLHEAKERGCNAARLLKMTWTSDTDSEGAAWSAPLDRKVKVGTDYMSLLEQLVETSCEARVDGATLDLHLAVEMGVDRTTSIGADGMVVFQPGHNVTDLTYEGRGNEVRSSLLAYSDSVAVEINDPNQAQPAIRRELYLELGDAETLEQVNQNASAAFEQKRKAQETITVSLVPTQHEIPWVHFRVGDWVLAPNRHSVLTRYRVRAITATEDGNGVVSYVPELATIMAEESQRVARWLKSMVPGTAGGSVASTRAIVPDGSLRGAMILEAAGMQETPGRLMKFTYETLLLTAEGASNPMNLDENGIRAALTQIPVPGSLVVTLNGVEATFGMDATSGDYHVIEEPDAANVNHAFIQFHEGADFAAGDLLEFRYAYVPASAL